MAVAWACLALGLLGSFQPLESLKLPSQHRTYNIDNAFARWPNNTILYYLDAPSYSSNEQNYIRKGITAFTDNNNMQGCLIFTEVSPLDPRYKVRISPKNASGILQPFCYTFPGLNQGLINSGAKEQLLILTRGIYGCLDGSLRSIIRNLALLVGKRNEHQRGDRDNFIAVNDGNIVVPNSYRKYEVTEAYWERYPYDYCSITHNQPRDYAVPGTVGFTVVNNPPAIPKWDVLSTSDCKIIGTIYNCPTSCILRNCYAAMNGAALGARTATPKTSAALTTTPSPCDLSRFCKVSPDESSFTFSPQATPQTMILFSGRCVMEYRFIFSGRQIIPNSVPKGFSDYFAAPGGPSFTPPVNLAYMDLDPDTFGASLTINMNNAATATQLTCSTNLNPQVADTCPTPASTFGAATPLSAASSASTQMDPFSGLVYQYVVLPSTSNTEIGLMDAQFSKLYSKTVNFLSGQNSIKSITAIQILTDDLQNSNPVLGVFGVGADGVTPYVGFAQLLLNADTSLSLTDPLVIQASHWDAEPKPLNQVVQGC